MLMREYKVFHGVGAVVVKVKSHHLLSVLAITTDDVPFDFSKPSRRFDVDLTLTPGRGGTSDWSKVKFDDRGVNKHGKPLLPAWDPRALMLGVTTLGSGPLQQSPNELGVGEVIDDQTRGIFVGAVYIESTHYNEIYDTCIGSTGVLWPTNYCDLAEITTIAYSNNTDNGKFARKRYQGFLATVKDTSATTLSVTFARNQELGTVSFDRSGIDFDDDPPQEACGSAASLATAPKGTDGVLFVRLERAAELELTDPKLPIGLGLGDDALRLRRTRAVQVPAAMERINTSLALQRARSLQAPAVGERINISLANPDRVLAQVLDKIDGEMRVSGAFPQRNDQTGVVGVIKAVKGPVQRVGIDLISHSKHGVLQFGNWVIDENEKDSTKLLQAWESRSPGQIRLLGCNTAYTQAGQAAIRHLKSVFNVPVYGASVPLYARDFGPHGLTTDVLVECSDMLRPLPNPVPDTIVNQWFERFQSVPGARLTDIRDALRAETLDEATLDWTNTLEANRWPKPGAGDRNLESLDALFDSLGPSFVTAPGLLELPDSEQLYSAGSREGVPMFHRVTSLLNGTFLRVYPAGYPGGVLFRRPRGT